MDGVCRDVSILAIEGNLDDYQIVNMLQIIPDITLGVFRVSFMDDQVPGGPDGYLVCNMA
jgi:hypothetical protein